MNNLERRFGKFSITNLTMYLIIGRIFCFLLLIFGQSEILGYLGLDPVLIMNGQVWRLFTFIFIPHSSPFWFIFEIMFLYWIGNGLESVWGSFKYTMYYLGSVAGVTVAVVISYFIGIEALFAAYLIPSLFIYTMFLPFAWYFGEEEMRVMLMIPIKVKYLAIVNIILILMVFTDTVAYPRMWIIFILSMINMIVFFGYVFIQRIRNKARYAGFKSKVISAERNTKKAIHRCTICGITEKDDPGMSFRYCSKCEGDYEYCEKHLKDHEHKSKIIQFKRD